jgi:hypothetical protein
MAQVRSITFTDTLANNEEERVLAGVTGVIYKVCGMSLTGVASGAVLLKDGAGTGIIRVGTIANTPLLLAVLDPEGRVNYGRTAVGTGVRIRRITGGPTLTTLTLWYVEEASPTAPASGGTAPVAGS